LIGDRNVGSITLAKELDDKIEYALNIMPTIESKK